MPSSTKDVGRETESVRRRPTDGRYFSLPRDLDCNDVQELKHALKECEDIKEILANRIEALNRIRETRW